MGSLPSVDSADGSCDADGINRGSHGGQLSRFRRLLFVRGADSHNLVESRFARLPCTLSLWRECDIQCRARRRFVVSAAVGFFSGVACRIGRFDSVVVPW